MNALSTTPRAASGHQLGVRGKLFFLSIALVLAGITAAETLLLPRLVAIEMERSRAEIERLARIAGHELEREAPAVAAPRLANLLKLRVTYISVTGTVLGDSDVPGTQLGAMESHRHRPEIEIALTGQTGFAERRSATLGTRFLYAAIPPAGNPRVITRVALPLTAVETLGRRLRQVVVLTAALGVLVAAVLSGLASHLVSRSLREMTTAARALAARSFSGRIPVRSRDELGQLATALNDLSANLDATLRDLTHERDLLGAVLAGMAEGVLVTDKDGLVLRSNPALARNLGIPPLDGPRTLLEAIRQPDLVAHVRQVLTRATPARDEIALPGPPPRNFLLSSAPLDAGAGVVTVLHDVTELRRLERVRQDFVANVSHELRTPVAALQAAGETLLNGALRDPVAGPQFLEMISRNAERLGRLVSDLLELARLDAGKLDLHPQAVELAGACESALAPLRPRVVERQLTAILDVDPAVRVLADQRALGQILHNLLDNAIKYTPTGGRLGIATEALPSGVRIVVWDTGLGIEPRHAERLFERFYRVDPGRSRDMGGTGLGLSIVKNLVEAMSGQVVVEPRPGGGSRFLVDLPAAPPASS